jgi:hypothetical protein
MIHFDADDLGLVALYKETFSSGFTSFVFSRMGYFLSSDFATAGVKLIEGIIAVMVSLSLLKDKLMLLKKELFWSVSEKLLDLNCIVGDERLRFPPNTSI